MLSEILAEIKKFIADKSLLVSAQREARLVALVYDPCQEDKVKPDRIQVERSLSPPAAFPGFGSAEVSVVHLNQAAELISGSAMALRTVWSMVHTVL